jgi:molecular chaperone HtpG
LLIKDYEILYFTEDVDEFAIKMLMKYKDKEFKSVSDRDLGIESSDEKQQIEDEEKENKGLFEHMAKVLENKVKKVKHQTD